MVLAIAVRIHIILLPTGKTERELTMKVKLADVSNALERTDDFSEFSLDMQTGEIVWTNEMAMDREEMAEICDKLEEHGFRRLPSQYDINRYEIMDDFIQTLSGTAYSKLDHAIRGRGAFRRFKGGIRELGLEQNWYAYLAEAYRRIAIEWCEDNDIEFEE